MLCARLRNLVEVTLALLGLVTNLMSDPLKNGSLPSLVLTWLERWLFTKLARKASAIPKSVPIQCWVHSATRSGAVDAVRAPTRDGGANEAPPERAPPRCPLPQFRNEDPLRSDRYFL